jgi:putative transcriptional regulator
MAMRKKKSAILEAVHDTAKGLHRAGVMDLVTLREFDRLCLPPIELLVPEKIDPLRSDTALN